MIWKIDESEVFAINEDREVKVIEVGRERNKVVIVDDFYKNPDLVQHLALNAPASKWDVVTYGFPMWRTAMDLNLETVRAALSEIAKEVYAYEINEIPRFMTNLCINDSDLRSNPMLSGAPHCDKCVIAAVVYLNSPEECAGGTAIYRHRETGLESLPRHPFFQADLERIVPLAKQFGCSSLKEFADTIIFPQEAFLDDICITDSTEIWELLEVLEMKYNRLVFYEGKVFHAPYGQEGNFRDFYRAIQAMFWTGAIPV